MESSVIFSQEEALWTTKIIEIDLSGIGSHGNIMTVFLEGNAMVLQVVTSRQRILCKSILQSIKNRETADLLNIYFDVRTCVQPEASKEDVAGTLVDLLRWDEVVVGDLATRRLREIYWDDGEFFPTIEQNMYLVPIFSLKQS